MFSLQTKNLYSSKKFNYIVITIACILCYYNSYYCGFVFDDISAIKDNKDLRPNTPISNIFFNDFWGTPMKKEHSHKSYRPLTVLTFRWNYWLHELRPSGYHITNIVLHIIVCILYYETCNRTVFQSEKISLIASMLFVTHPTHTEAVTGVVGRAEILSSIFFLLSFLFYNRASYLVQKTNWKSLCLSLLCITFAMLCKEQGVTVAGICILYEIFVIQNIQIYHVSNIFNQVLKIKKSHKNLIKFSSEGIKRLLTIVVVTCLLLIFRLYIMGSQLPVFTRFDNPASVAPTPTRQLTFNYLVTLNLWLLLFPCDLCCDWTMGTVSLIKNFTDIRILSIIFTYYLLGKLLYECLTTKNKRKSKILFMGLSFLCLPFLPASNLFFPVGFVIAERVLYMPSMGFCIIIAYGYELLQKKFDTNKHLNIINAIKLSTILLIVVFSIKCYQRNWDWKTEYTIFMSGLKVNKNNAKLFNNVGHALESEEKYSEALQFFEKAVQIQNDDIGAYINVGRTLNNLKMYNEAELIYNKAKSLLPKPKITGESYQTRIAPNHLNVFLNLANLISKNSSRLEEADLLYRQAISMRSDYVQAYINRGDILMKLKRPKDAQEVYKRALEHDYTNPDIHYNLGVVVLEQGETFEALSNFNKALEYDPNHYQALLSSAILLQELGGDENRKISKERLFKILEKDKTNEKVYFNLGMLSMDDNNTNDAEYWFKEAIKIKDDFRSALFNLALLLADTGRPLDAVPYLNQLIKYYPNHTKGLILLGDIYINNFKDLDLAETCYRKILEVEPNNIQGLHNLCVVFVEQGKMTDALNCLEKAHKLAPHEDYIIRHLHIVRNRLKKINQESSSSTSSSVNLDN